jgi:hypothetical protein
MAGRRCAVVSERTTTLTGEASIMTGQNTSTFLIAIAGGLAVLALPVLTNASVMLGVPHESLPQADALVSEGQFQVAAADVPVVNAAGALRVPANYRTAYEYLGSWSVAGDDKGAKEMHIVFASPGAIESYRGAGHFADEAVLVKEVLEATTSEMTTGTVSHPTTLKGWFVMVRDSANTHPGNPLWGDGWGWSWFDADKPTKTTSTDYKTDCQSCHIPAQATDWIYVGGYGVLER